MCNRQKNMKSSTNSSKLYMNADLMRNEADYGILLKFIKKGTKAKHVSNVERIQGSHHIGEKQFTVTSRQEV